MATETIKFFIHPFTIFWILLLISAVTYLLKKERVFRWLLLLMVGWFFVITTPMVPMYMLKSLEDRYEPLKFPEDKLNTAQEIHIVVLGAGYFGTNRFPATTTLQSTTLKRLIEGVRLYNTLPNSKLITSGPYSFHNKPSQAEVAKSAAISLGVSPDDIFTQYEPYTTLEEAEIYAAKFYSGQQVIIVTDAAHMPRSMYEFEKLIDNPIAAPTSYSFTYKGMSIGDFSMVPSYSNIGKLSRALNEYAAIFRNRIRDRGKVK